MNFKVNSRFYKMSPIIDPKYIEEELTLDLNKTALIPMHIWNIGMEDGPEIIPDFAVGMCYPDNFAEGEKITLEKIVPLVKLARQIGMEIAHVTNLTIALRDPRARDDEDPVEGGELSLVPGGEIIEPVVPGWAAYIHTRAHGEYMDNLPYSKMMRAKVVDPLPGEIYVHQSDQLDRALRRKGIENLIYTGFATDMCILRAPGGSEPMRDRGYRIFLVRDATLGVEFPDTFKDRLMTFWGVRYFETHCGNTFLFNDLFNAMKEK